MDLLDGDRSLHFHCWCWMGYIWETRCYSYPVPCIFQWCDKFSHGFWKNPWHSEQLTPTWSKWYVKTARGVNRFFKVLHAINSIPFRCWSYNSCLAISISELVTTPIQMSSTQAKISSGEKYTVAFDDGRSVALNIYCTGPPSRSTPTLWFESSQAHGITDFLGVQTYLLGHRGRHSCPYIQS